MSCYIGKRASPSPDPHLRIFSFPPFLSSVSIYSCIQFINHIHSLGRRVQSTSHSKCTSVASSSSSPPGSSQPPSPRHTSSGRSPITNSSGSSNASKAHRPTAINRQQRPATTVTHVPLPAAPALCNAHRTMTRCTATTQARATPAVLISLAVCLSFYLVMLVRGNRLILLFCVNRFLSIRLLLYLGF
jgi:hypothetical protein